MSDLTIEELASQLPAPPTFQPPPPPVPPTSPPPQGYTTQLDRSPTKKGGRIVKPSSPQYPAGSSRWVDNPRGVIPLDRGGPKLPRYMQETSGSKTKLAYKHQHQNQFRQSRKHKLAAQNHHSNLVEQHRKLVHQCNEQQLKKTEWVRLDNALDIDLQHVKEDLAALEAVGSQEQIQETTRARMEREFNSFQTEMKKQIEELAMESEKIAVVIDTEQQQHHVVMDAMKEEHDVYVTDKKHVLEALDQQIAQAYRRNFEYFQANEAAMLKAQKDLAVAEEKLVAIYRSGIDLKRALVVEGGADLHQTKLYNAKQHHYDSEKYRNMATHLRLETEQLLSSLMEVEAERDMLMEQSRSYSM